MLRTMRKAVQFTPPFQVAIWFISLCFSLPAVCQSDHGPQINQLLHAPAGTLSRLGMPFDGPQFSLMAPPAADLDQYRNGPFNNPNNTCTNWVNGNAGEQNSHYIEGWSIPYRCVMTDLPLNTSITLTLGYDIRNSSKNALDYLTYFQRMSPHDIFCDTAHHNPECVTPALGGFSNYPIPAPSSTGSPVAGMPTTSFNALPASQRLMRLYGGFIDTIYYVTQGSLNAAQSETTINVVFHVNSANAVLAWGGHIASRIDWGATNSAAGISGSPYHMRLVDWSLNNLGNQDRSLSGGAIAPFCQIAGVDTTCAGATQQYCVANQNGITYSWAVISGDATIVGSNSGNCVNIHAGSNNYTLEITLTSSFGLCSHCSKTVVVEASAPCSIDGPSEVCPGGVTQYCAPAGATSYSWSISGAGVISGPKDQACVTVVPDNSCNGSFTLSLFAGGSHCGAMCTKVTAVKDKTGPILTCPDDITVSCTTEVPDPNTAAVATSDNCGGSVTVTHTGDAPGGSCPTTITRTYQGADACGNTADCEQIITIDDKIAPGLTCPDDITVFLHHRGARPEHCRRRHLRQLRRTVSHIGDDAVILPNHHHPHYQRRCPPPTANRSLPSTIKPLPDHDITVLPHLPTNTAGPSRQRCLSHIGESCPHRRRCLRKHRRSSYHRR